MSFEDECSKCCAKTTTSNDQKAQVKLKATYCVEFVCSYLFEIINVCVKQNG